MDSTLTITVALHDDGDGGSGIPAGRLAILVGEAVREDLLEDELVVHMGEADRGLVSEKIRRLFSTLEDVYVQAVAAKFAMSMDETHR